MTPKTTGWDGGGVFELQTERGPGERVYSGRNRYGLVLHLA